MTFQLTWRPPAASDMSQSRDFDSSSVGPPAATSISRLVPGWSTSTEQRASTSSREAWRLGTGRPSASLWVVDHVDEKPMAPADRPSLSSVAMASNSASVASRSVASSPMTTRRMAEWPTLKPALTARSGSTASRYSAVVRQFHGTPSRSDSKGMPSTRESIRMRYSPSAGLSDSGAMVKPQFPPMTVVTPCRGDGLSVPSQKTWAS